MYLQAISGKYSTSTTVMFVPSSRHFRGLFCGPPMRYRDCTGQSKVAPTRRRSRSGPFKALVICAVFSEERTSWIKSSTLRTCSQIYWYLTLYLTSMPCSCPSYHISRFLLCKHIVRTVNIHLQGFKLQPEGRFVFLNLSQKEPPSSHHFTTSLASIIKHYHQLQDFQPWIRHPTKRKLEDGTVVASGPGLAAEKATRTYEGVIHEEMPMADDGQTCERILNIPEAAVRLRSR